MGYRTRLGGDLRADDAGQRVTLSGWVATRRDHGGLAFVDLRDRSGIVQLVFDPDEGAEAHAAAHELRNEFVIQVEGVVAPRSPENVNPKLATGHVEVRVDTLTLLNRSAVLPFQLDEENVDESLRMHHRYLDLRRERMRHNLETRFRLTQIIRRHMEEHEFWELETPILYKSTPEGAKEFLVPTSSRPGQFYALPQSPQTFKQLYAIAGYERYYQIARCFRDEATRADRTQEFTQLDIEMAFLVPDELFGLLEAMFARIWGELRDVELETPFPRMSWDEATLRYGSDKPDLRFGAEISDVTDLLAATEFKAFRGVVDGGGVVRGLAVPGAGEFSRKDFDDLVEFAKGWGGKGVAWLQVQGGGEIRSPIAKFLSEAELAGIVQRIGAGEGDTVFLVADGEEAAVRVLGPLRLHLGERLGLIEQGWRFLWVTDFPMFEWLPDEGRWKASHNPFSAPAPGFEEFWTRSRRGPLLPVRPGAERQRDRRRLDPQSSPGDAGQGVRAAGHLRRAGGGELLLPAARALDGSAAPRWHRVRARPAGDAGGRGRLSAGGDRLPERPGRRRSAHRRSRPGERRDAVGAGSAVARSTHVKDRRRVRGERERTAATVPRITRRGRQSECPIMRRTARNWTKNGESHTQGDLPTGLATVPATRGA